MKRALVFAAIGVATGFGAPVHAIDTIVGTSGSWTVLRTDGGACSAAYVKDVRVRTTSVSPTKADPTGAGLVIPIKADTRQIYIKYPGSPYALLPRVPTAVEAKQQAIILGADDLKRLSGGAVYQIVTIGSAGALSMTVIDIDPNGLTAALKGAAACASTPSKPNPTNPTTPIPAPNDPTMTIPTDPTTQTLGTAQCTAIAIDRMQKAGLQPKLITAICQ